MGKLRRAVCKDGSTAGWIFHCPGCDEAHWFDAARWTKTGPDGAPTFSPSLVVAANDPARRCHLFVREGQIQYLPDCHHRLAGKTVKMEETD